MEFSLFGFDFMPNCGLFGAWLFGIKTNDDYARYLFSVYLSEGTLLFDLCWFRILTF